jgi:Tfp pilus assembly protein PilX
MSARPPSKTDFRSGAILAMVLASILVAGMLGLALIKTVLVHHRQIRVIGRQQQCFWLAEAGVQRAVRSLAQSSDYGGEKWELSADVLGDATPAVVTIEIAKLAGSGDARELRVEARFSGAPTRPNACRRVLAVSVPPRSAASPGNSKAQPKDTDAAPKAPNDSQQ